MTYLVNVLYIVAFALFILGLSGLTGPKTAVRGNWIAATGMGIAVAKFNGRIMQSNQTLRHQVLPVESAIYPVKPFRKAELSSVPEKALRTGPSLESVNKVCKYFARHG